MATKKTITEAEILSEIQKSIDGANGLVGQREPGTITAPELATKLEISKPRARVLLTGLLSRGILTPDYVWRVDPWGVRTKSKGYRLTALNGQGDKRQ